MKASDLFVRCLEEEGVEYIFGVPGEENLDLLESLRTSEIRLIVTRHEQHAAFMAATYGRLTGRAGVCLATLGPGATNLLTGVAFAQLGGMPLLAITGQKALRDNRQGKFQLIDIVDMFQPVTKWNDTITAGGAVPRSIRHAFKVAEHERPGAVHLELPEDIAGEEVDEARPHPRINPRRPVPDDTAIERAVALIRAATCPVLVVSSGGNRKRVARDLRQFVEASGIFVVATQMGKGVLPDDNPHSLFCLGIHKYDYVHSAIEAADLVITLGYNIVEYPPSVWNGDKDKRILHIDFEPAEPDEFYNPEFELIGDISSALTAMRAKLDGDDLVEGHFAELRSEIEHHLFDTPCPWTYPPSPRVVVREVRQTLGAEDIVSLDNGIYKIWFARMYRTYADNTVLLDNALASMGAGLAAAMAAKMVHPQRRVLAVCGDGGFMMNSQDMETAIRLGQDLVVLILRDEAYGFIRWKQSGEGFANFGMDFGNPDFVKYAEAYGAHGLRASDEKPLRETLEEAFQLGGVVLVDCRIDYSENSELDRDLRQEVAHLADIGRGE